MTTRTDTPRRCALLGCGEIGVVRAAGRHFLFPLFQARERIEGYWLPGRLTFVQEFQDLVASILSDTEVSAAASMVCAQPDGAGRLRVVEAGDPRGSLRRFSSRFLRDDRKICVEMWGLAPLIEISPMARLTQHAA